MENINWYEQQKKVMHDNMQAKFEEEFEKTHEVIMKYANLTLKDKGTLRNINNYRMKLWCDIYLESFKSNTNNDCFLIANEAIIEFDKRFNQ